MVPFLRGPNNGWVMLNWILFTFFIASLMLSLLSLGIDTTYHLKYEPRLERHHQKLHSQHKRLSHLALKFSQHPVLSQPDSNEDQPDFASLLKDHNWPLVPEDQKKAILSLGHSWMEKKYILPPSTAVPAFMEKVATYKHWKANPHDLTLLDIHPIDFIVLVQVYLAQTYYHHPQELLSALNNTRALSHILLSSESINLKRAALSLLNKERELVDFVSRRKGAPPIDWQVVSPEDIKGYIELMHLSSLMVSALSPQDILQQLPVQLQHHSSLLCAVMFNKLSSLEWELSLLTPNFIFEPSFAAPVEQIHQLVGWASSQCSQKEQEPIRPHTTWARHVPFYRRIFAIGLTLGEARGR
jgi:hypothetical protein